MSHKMMCDKMMCESRVGRLMGGGWIDEWEIKLHQWRVTWMNHMCTGEHDRVWKFPYYTELYA